MTTAISYGVCTCGTAVRVVSQTLPPSSKHAGQLQVPGPAVHSQPHLMSSWSPGETGTDHEDAAALESSHGAGFGPADGAGGDETDDISDILDVGLGE